MQELQEHVKKIAEKRRTHPKDDLISHLLQAHHPGNLLSEEECFSQIILLLAAGNRDPKIFHHPETLDISRQKKHLLSFSGGIHNCLGMHLGLTLFEIGLQTLLQKVPQMQIENIDEPEWNLSYTFRGLKRLIACK